jgi:hypothetical protein
LRSNYSLLTSDIIEIPVETYTVLVYLNVSSSKMLCESRVKLLCLWNARCLTLWLNCQNLLSSCFNNEQNDPCLNIRSLQLPSSWNSWAY